MKLNTIFATATLALAFSAQASSTKSYCTAERDLPDGAKTYGSGWKASEAEAQAVALDRCEADVIVFPSSCEITNCTTRTVR